MASLTNNKIKETYQSLVKFNDNGNITTSAKRLTDGFGNNSPFFVSTTQIGIGVTPTLGFDLHVNSNAKIGGNLNVGGNLTVSGTLTYLDVEDLATEDPLIKLARNNVGNTLDIGFFGKYIESSVTKYKGIFNDADDDKWHFFIGTSTEPTTVVDTAGTGYTKADIVIGDINSTGGTFSGQITIPQTPTADGHAASKKYVDDSSNDATQTLAEVLTEGNTSGANDIIMADNQKISFGTDSDLNIDYNSTGDFGRISNESGHLYIQNTSDDRDIIFRSDDGSGGLAVYFKLDGSTATSGSYRYTIFPDYSILAFGSQAYGDLRIFHDGTHSYIYDAGTGRLNVRTSQFRVVNAANSEIIIDATENGSVDLYYDNSKKFETTSYGAKVTNKLTINTDSTSAVLNISGTGISTERGIRITSTNSAGFSEIQFASDNEEFRIGVGGSTTGSTYRDKYYIYSVTGGLVATFDESLDTIFYGDVTIDGTLTPDFIELFDVNGTVSSRFKIYAWDDELQFTKRNLTTGVHTGTLLALDYTDDSATFSGTVLIDGVSNYTGLEVKGTGASRPAIQFSNVNQGDLGIIYGTESNALVIGTGTSGIAALTLDNSQNATFAGDIYGNLIELQGYGFKGGEGDLLDSSTFGKSGIGNTFRWIEQNSAASGSTWRKVCDVTLNTTFFDGVQMEVVVWQPSTNWGNTASLIKNYYSIAFRGSQSDVGPFFEDAIVYGINEDLLRVYKVSTNNYELQARSDDNNRDLVVEYTITSKNNAKVTPNDSYTAATTSGGTAYTASANTNTKTKFAGEIEFQGSTIGDDLRVNGNLFFGTGADTTYGGYITQYGSADHGISIRVEDTDGFVINTVYGNAGEAYESFSITDTIELKDSNETLLEVSLNQIDISAPTIINVGETEVGLSVFTTNASTTPNVKFGRNAAEYIGFSVGDRYNEMIFRQDETTGTASAILDIWSSTTGNVDFTIRKSNSAGASSSNWMVIQDGDTTFNGTLTVEDQLFANAGGNNYHILTNESNNGTVLRLDCTGDNTSLYFQGDHIYASGTLVIGNASSGPNLFRGTYHTFQSGVVSISTINNATTNTDKFLVSDSGTIKYRTAAQLADDILTSIDDEFVRYDGTAQTIDKSGTSLVKLKNTNTGTSGYAEIRLDNDNNDYVIIGSIGSGYTSSSFAGQSYVYSNRTLALKSSTGVDIYAGGHGTSNKKILIASNQTTFQHAVYLSLGNFIYMDRGSSDYSNIIGSTNYPSKGYTGSTQKYWLYAQSKGGFHIILNSDGSDGSSENAYDDFVIFQGSHDGTARFRVSNIGNTFIDGKLTVDGANGIITNNGGIELNKTNTASGGDFDFIKLDYNGGWSQNAEGLAAVNVTDGTGTVGKFGVTYNGSQGVFVVTNLYSGGYGATGDMFRVTPSGISAGSGTELYGKMLVGSVQDSNRLTIGSKYNEGGGMLTFRSGHPNNSTIWNLAEIFATDDGNYNGRIEFRTGVTGTANLNTATKMTLKATGYLGIGETNPQSPLVVRRDSVAGRGGEITILNYATNTVGNEAALNFGLENSTYDGNAGNAQIAARVMSSNAASDMIFATWNGSSFGERLRIQSGGNIGINNNDPNALLVVGPDAHGNATGLEVNAGSGGANIICLGSTHHNWFPYTDGNNYYSAGIHIFRNSSHGSEWMRINATGQVGIGTTGNHFGEKLRVQGWITAGSNTIISLMGENSIGAVMGAYSNHPLILRTNNTERARFTSAGLLGINTSNPTVGGFGGKAYLHVYSNSNGEKPTIHVSCHDYDEAALVLSENSGSNGFGARVYYEGSGNNFYNVSIIDNNSVNHAFTIDRYRNCALGTTVPETKLDVRGKMLLNGQTSSGNKNFYDAYVDSSSAYYHQATMTIRMDDNSTGGIDETEVGLLIHNNTGVDNSWVKIALGGREASGSGNTVSYAGIAAKKVSGTANSWARGELHIWTKNNGSQIDAGYYGYDGIYYGNYYHNINEGAQIRKGINLRRDHSAQSGISFYSPTYHNWQIYMSPAGTGSSGANGNLTASSGLSSVSSWALRSRMEGVSTYGWLWETGGSGGGGATASAKMELGATTGTLRVTGDMVAYASDGRLKTNIVKIDNALEKVKQISGVEYDWVDNIEEEYDFHPNQKHEVGVIAQEIEKVLPEAVMTAPFNNPYTEKCGKDHNFLTVKYERIVPLLIESIKELTAKVEALENKKCNCK
jgi:hypothetical protein